nr:zinc-ribbon domain-containing protein [uncultured Stomatobaculum sp.]
MYCRYCGAELKPEAKFCTSCGMKIQPFGKAEEAKAEQPKTEQTGVAAGAAAAVNAEAAKAAAPKAEQPEPAAKMPPEEKKPEGGKSKKGLLLIPLFLLLAGLGVGVGIFIGSRQGGGKESDPFAKRETRESSETSAEGSGESTAAEDASESGADGDSEAAEREEKFVLADENTELGALQRSIATLNSEAAAGQRIAINEIKHSVGVRNPGESWNSDVFYTLEGYENRPGYVNKNLCRLEQKQLINADTGNLIDYTVYINPNDGVANKIVAIEYLVSGGLQVTEYYYDANRMPRFVYQYLIDNYVAGYAVPDKAGERFLFGSDTLLTWRAVRDGGFKWNCAANASEAERLRKSWPANTIFLYQNENADMRRAFDERESIMLNAAYNTYETVMNAQNLTGISGYAYDEQGQGVENARVLLYRSEDRKLLYEGKTDADGRYRIVVPGESRQYELRLVKAPYRSCEIYGINVDSEQLAAYQTPVYFLPRGGAATDYRLRLGDALHYNESGSGMRTVFASVINVRAGINNRTGRIVSTAQTDGSGVANVKLRPGVYTVELVADGYETVYDTLVARSDGETEREFFAAPTVGSGQVSIVLTWGAVPADLDSHLFTQRGAESSHVWFGGKVDSFGNDLDVDDVSSYGPETVTIKQFSAQDYYKYCVVDFTNSVYNNFQSYELSNSGATVQVYTDQGLAATYHVPTNRPGVVWEIFEIRNGRITPIQRYYNYASTQDWWMHD